MRFELFMAARYLRAKRRQAVIGIITTISIVGVAAGVAALIVAMAVENGFRRDLQASLLGSTSHVNLLRVEADGIRDWQPLLNRLDRTPHVVAGAPALYEQVLVSRGARARGLVLKGILPAYESKVSDLLKNVKIGSADLLAPPKPCPNTPAGPPLSPDKPVGSSFPRKSVAPPGAVRTELGDIPGGPRPDCYPQGIAPDPNAPPDSLQRIAALPPILLGQDSADNLGATVGSVVLVTSPQGELTPFGIVPKYTRFKVVGIFNTGFYDYDSGWAFIRLSDAQSLFGLGDVVSVLEFKVDDIYQAAQIGDQLEKEAGPGFMATNWMEQNKQLFRALSLERMVTFIIIGLIVLVAALNILISLIMMVMEKTRDIAVLMSMGARRGQVWRVFMAQGVLIGVLGTILGLAVGYGLSWFGAHYRLIALSPEVYSIDHVPFAPRAIDGLIVAAVALGVSFIATLYPSWSASKIYPAEALRYE